MSNTISLYEPSVNTLMASWTGLQLERSTGQAGGPWAVVVDIPYVTNQTTYTYVDSAGGATDWYRVARYLNPGPTLSSYSNPWRVEGPQLSRRSLANCCRILADRINSLTLVTTDSTATDSNSIVASQLALAINDQNRYRNQWAYIYDGTEAGVIRKIGDNALTTSTGRLAVGPIAFSAPIQAGVQVEIHQLMPPRTGLDGASGLQDCLNHALREVWVLDRLSVAAVTGQASYDLGTLFSGLADWLDPDAVIEFYGPQVATMLNIVPWGGFNTVQDAESLQVQVSPGLTTGQTATVEITRPGNTYMKIGGVWTDNQDGFVNDSDESLFRPDRLAEVALVYAYNALALNSQGAEKQGWQSMALQQRRQVNVWKRTQLPHPSRRMGVQRPLGASAGYPYGGDLKSWWT